MRRSIATLEDQRATFIELFFDLVFVYAVTGVVVFIHDDLSWMGAARGVVLFWLVWWAWTQFTWALNSTDTTHPLVDATMLLVTAVAFLMAVTVPSAFGGAGVWFAVTYVTVRLLGLAVYSRVAWEDSRKRNPVLLFAALSVGGMVAVLGGGVADAEARVWWWAAALVLDLIAATIAGSAEGWDIQPEHFGERHGLFVIIALGESLIVAASELSLAEPTGHTVAVGVLAVAVVCCLWWLYFVSIKPALDRAVEHASGARRTVLARDVYSILHFPLVLGIVLLAVAIEAAVAHPDESLTVAESLALWAGIALFVLSAAATLWRAGRRPPLVTAATIAGVGAAIWAGRVAPAPWQLFVVVLGLVLLVASERARSSASTAIAPD